MWKNLLIYLILLKIIYIINTEISNEYEYQNISRSLLQNYCCKQLCEFISYYSNTKCKTLFLKDESLNQISKKFYISN